jgi:hypothetical protein
MHALHFTKLCKLHLVACITMLLSAVFASTSQINFSDLYDYYFPKQGGGVLSSVYRPSFDKELFGPPPKPEQERYPEFYYAFHGDAAALHRFFHNADRSGEGEFGETWAYECLVLLLRLGDEKFSELLAKEDSATREAVGNAVDSLIDWRKHQFPKTRALYAYRHVAPTERELDQRNREPVAVAWKGITDGQSKRIQEMLAREKRFSDVQITTTNEGITSFTAPRSMSSKDKADLQRLVRRELKNTKEVQYYP